MSLSTLEQYGESGLILSSANETLYSPEQLQAFLDSATAYLQSMCYQVLESEETVEILTLGNLYCSVGPNGWLNIFPKRAPVTAVESVEYRYLPAGDWTEIDTEGWAVDDDGRIIIPAVFPARVRGAFVQVRVTYTAGYAEVPMDLVEANNLVAAHFASGGYAAVDSQGNSGRPVVPNWAWGNGGRTKSIVDEIIDRYGRKF